jgi:hypothetical protein
VAETEPNGTLDVAQNLGDLSTASRLEVVGNIGHGPARAADVDWYQFQLDRPASVTLSTPPGADANGVAVHPITALSLYNSDPFDGTDTYDPLGHRLLAQDDSVTHSGGATITRQLAPGTYYAAVSGSGNHYFHPYLDGSGTAGAVGDYGLLITSTDLNIQPTDGPVVLAADPAANSQLDRSPFFLRVDLSENLNPISISAGTTVQLLTNPNGTFGDGKDQPVPLQNVVFRVAPNELLLEPAAPLVPGSYKVFLAGDSSTGNPVLTDQSGNPLGSNAAHLTGADYSYTFQITGNEGLLGPNAPADDTPANAHQLGDVTQAGLVQVAGVIGVDSTDPSAFNPASVEMYHFQISGAGRYAFVGEVFAGRIGSPLDSAVTLFQVGPGDNQLHYVAANDDTLNNAEATNHMVPLFTDSAVYAGLTAGDYYIVVSGGGNVPNMPTVPPGTNGVFDPNVTHSGSNGYSTGSYVLNLRVQPSNLPPQVISTTPAEGAILSSPPTQLTVQFSAPVNLQPLVYYAFQQTSQTALSMFYIQGSDGTKYFPRLLSYDQASGQANFLMLDGLANGRYQLHLSGPLELTDFGGNPLAGNDASGDYIVHFTVSSPPRGTGGDPLNRTDQEPNDDLSHAQDLGVLFPRELQSGVTLSRNFSTNPATRPSDTADFFRFQVLQYQDYSFNLLGTNLPAGAQVRLFDTTGQPVQTAPIGSGPGVHASLNAGTYVIEIGSWSTGPAVAPDDYELVMRLNGLADNPSPLVVGPEPAIGIHLVSSAPPPPAPVFVAVTLPPPATPPTSVVTNTPPPSSTATTTVATPSVTTAPAPATSTVVAAVTTVPTSPPTAPVATHASAPAAPIPTSVVTVPATPPAPSAPSTPAPPAPSTISTLVVVALVAPSGLNVSAPQPSTSRSAPVDAVSQPNPSGVLLALGTPTIGGVKDPSGGEVRGPDLALIRLPDLSPRQDARPQPVILASNQSGTVEPSQLAAPSAPVDAAKVPEDKPAEEAPEPQRQGSNVRMELYRPPVQGKSWERIMDALFEATRWLQALNQAGVDFDASAEDSLSPSSAGDENLEVMAPPADGQSLSSPEQALASGVAAVGVLALWNRDRRNSTSTSAPRVRRLEEPHKN